MRASNRFQIAFGLLFWAVLIGGFLAAEDSCNGPSRHHTIRIHRDPTLASTGRAEKERSEKFASLANRCYRQRDYHEAVIHQLEAVKANPEDARHAYNLACYLCVGGAIGHAFEAFEVAVELDPYYGNYALHDKDFHSVRGSQRFTRIAYIAAGLHAVREKKYRTAHRHFQHVVARGLDGNLPADTLYAMASAASKSDRPEDALGWLDRAVGKDLQLAKRAIKDSSLANLKNRERFYEIVSPAFQSIPFQNGNHSDCEAEEELPAEAPDFSF